MFISIIVRPKKNNPSSVENLNQLQVLLVEIKKAEASIVEKKTSFGIIKLQHQQQNEYQRRSNNG